MEPQQSLDENTIVQCFIHIHNPSSSAAIRKQADMFLIECESKVVALMKILVSIFQNSQNYNQQIRLQALIHLSNVIKRNWNNKRLLKTQKQLPNVKKQISAHLITLIQGGDRIFMKSLFDVVGFIAKADYPHAFPQLTSYTLFMLENIQINDDNVRYFKAIREIFLQIAQRKGFVSHISFQQGPLKILNQLGPITEVLRQQLSGAKEINPYVAKLSKYCDQILISLMRLAPYTYLDDQNFMLFVDHISQKLQNLLTIHSEQTDKNKALIEKDIKSIIYQMGCLQVVNPCIMGRVLQGYIQTLFYVISKPDLFTKAGSVKYSLLSMRKIVKQFTYFAENTIFQKSMSSQMKSNNYISLRNEAYNTYKNFLTQDTVQDLFTFLLVNIMNIKSKQDEGFTVGFDENINSTAGYQKSTEKDLSVHVCGLLLSQSLIERFPQKMLATILDNIQTCIDNNWSNIDTSTLINFLSIVSILPKSCRKAHFNYLSQFPIISVLQFVHGASVMKIKEKFPSLICGWLDIFTNEQIVQLIQALLNYVEEGSQSNSMEMLLYSCYSLNKIVTLKSSIIDCGYILHKIFPIAIKVFDCTQNPEILWPLINLISTLLTKCQFDTNIIVNSVESNSLSSLISNESQMLVQALCQMFKSFLCIIPRNKPAIAVFRLVYHFLNNHLSKTSAIYHQKCINLWYYSIRQFSSVNQCNELFYQLFQNHFKRCMLHIKPVLIYILEEYMLLGIIESKLDDFVHTVIQFYREAECIQANENLSNTSHPSSRQEINNLKIAALSFQITLITKYNIQKVNSQQMLCAIIKDFCSIGNNNSTVNDQKFISNTLQNSLLSIVNRYIMLYCDYFFEFLITKVNITPPVFYEHYFRNMSHLTSRTAMKINTLALTSLLTKVQQHFKPYDGSLTLVCICKMVQTIIPQIESISKSPYGSNLGQVQNSPILRFSQNILSERKQLIRKQGTYQNIDMRQYFLTEMKGCLDAQGLDIDKFAGILQNSQKEKDWGHRLYSICK